MTACKSCRCEVSGLQHFVHRGYRETSPLQWVRETYENARQAGATQILYSTEWQAVENMGVHRRLIADEGCGMSDRELVTFFNVYGGGGKPIGDVHENFGIGAKTTLLPWNRYGLVVVSYKQGVASMIRIQWDPEREEYGLRAEESEEGDQLSVYEPFDDAEEAGCDWSTVAPKWVRDAGHGTVLVLLGNEGSQNTILGDPERPDEADLKGIPAYLNRRLWEVPAGVRIDVHEYRNTKPQFWPRTQEEALTGFDPEVRPPRRPDERDQVHMNSRQIIGR